MNIFKWRLIRLALYWAASIFVLLVFFVSFGFIMYDILIHPITFRSIIAHIGIVFMAYVICSQAIVAIISRYYGG